MARGRVRLQITGVGVMLSASGRAPRV